MYGCLFLGKNAYGVVDLSEGTEVIVKPRGSSGTADPLDQRSSVGWKGVHAAAILYNEYMVRVECGSSYSGQDKANGQFKRTRPGASAPGRGNRQNTERSMGN